MNLPPHLIEKVKSNQVVLFLGAGASIDAEDRNGKNPPTGAGLAKLISDKFLGGQFEGYNLSTVAEHAITESSLLELQEFIKGVFDPFQPSETHRLMTRIGWKAIATTNYDLVIERAYEAEKERAIQSPKPFIENGDQIAEKLRDPKSIPYLKLHGCITRVSNEKCPLILSLDQYIRYKEGRSRLFSQFRDLAYEHTIVFVGHRGEDSNIRETIFRLDTEMEDRPRYFAVLPNCVDIEKRTWESKRVTILDGTFNQFLNSLDDALPDEFRNLVTTSTESHPISRRFRVRGETLTQNCKDFLISDATYVNSVKLIGLKATIDFYKGHMTGWDEIDKNLDIRRDYSDDIISDVILVDDLQARKDLEVILIKGHAGSGKSVSLRRIAWDSANEYDRLCIYVEDAATINIGAIQEIIELCKERLFLFVDNAQDRAVELRRLVTEVGDHGELLTVITASRSNEWNAVYSELQSAVTTEYEVTSLNRKEISALIGKLRQHNALGKLEDKTEEEQFHEFERAGRQLLVALHETTMGMPFEQILKDEYEKIGPLQAQQVYLTVCILNRLGVPVRAGIISRIHNIRFINFKDDLFDPLEHVVYSSYEQKIRENAYRARHPIIAEIVFEQILHSQPERFTEYFRTLEALNIDYSTDSEAFRHMIRGRNLVKLFTNHEYCESIYEKAFSIAGDEPNLLQQRALYEMHRPNGNLQYAAGLISEAIELQPYNKGFKHTQAELALRRAESARTKIERDKFLAQATKLANESKQGAYRETHSHHTLAKINICRLEAELKKGDTDFSTPSIRKTIKAIEAEIHVGLQAKPGDSYLLTEQAKLAELMNNNSAMVESLEEAFNNNTKLSYLAIQLSSCYKASGDDTKSKLVLERALEANRTDKNLNYRYGLYLIETGAKPSDQVYHLRRAFVPGDKNYDAQLRYCLALFLNEDYEQLRSEIDSLKKLRTPPFIKNRDLYGAPKPVAGVVNGVKHSHIFATEANSQLSAYIPRSEVSPESWVLISVGTKVKFEVNFSFKGLLGTNCGII